MQFVSVIPDANPRAPYKYGQGQADEIRAAAGKWGILRTEIASNVLANAAVSYIRSGKVPAFGPDFEITARYSEQTGHTVYARYVGKPATIRTRARSAATVTGKK